MDIMQEYLLWTSKELADPALNQELAAIAGDEAEIADRFYRNLEFGTGGLRGIIGAGTNRMNDYTVQKASQGLASYLLHDFTSPSAVIAYDTRNRSLEFAEAAARVLCGNGVRVYLFAGTRPTPMLSFAVRYLKASAGIVITASHNPYQYNGYKVYGADGGQITDLAAEKILGFIEACDIFEGVKSMPLEAAEASGLLQMIGEEADRAYYEKVKNLVMRRDLIREQAGTLNILYSPLHGSGNIPVRTVLTELGFTQLTVVPEQELPDGNFPTVPAPNPEDPAVFTLAIELAKRTAPDLIFATDPDSDRIGVLVKNAADGFSVLTGNQAGALLCDYIIKTRKELGTLPENPAVIKTIVTTDIARSICAASQTALAETLTGFKYIGEKIGEWEKNHEYTFLFGFEESYGYLAGDFVRDKDAVIAAALIAEMALYYKTQGLSMAQALAALYEQYGYYREKLISKTLPGQAGQARIREIMAELRTDYRTLLAGQALAVLEDYQEQIRIDCMSGAQEKIALPKSEVLKFIFADGGWMAFRPSGTEPKIKAYLAVRAEDEAGAEQKLKQLENVLELIV